MTKAKTLFDLILYVNSRRVFTAQDVAFQFKISLRTAHRYLIELGEMGIPIYTEQGRNGGYRTLDIRTLPPIIFDENEIFAIFFAFQALTFYGSLPFSINTESVSRKIYANLTDDIKTKIDRLESVLLFWNQKRNLFLPDLKKIIDASLNCHILDMKYESKSGNKVRKVKPIGLYSESGFWYMPAFDLQHQEIRVFRVDRILSLEDTEEVLNIETSLREWISTHTINEPIRLFVSLTGEGIRQCRSVSWLESEIIETSDGNGTIDMIVDKNEIPFLAGFFISLGPNAKVIKPEEMIDLMVNRASDLIKQYQ